MNLKIKPECTNEVLINLLIENLAVQKEMMALMMQNASQNQKGKLTEMKDKHQHNLLRWRDLICDDIFLKWGQVDVSISKEKGAKKPNEKTELFCQVVEEAKQPRKNWRSLLQLAWRLGKNS